jgi:Ser/Thr protein kinase RdoA (MazF antagonist)
MQPDYSPPPQDEVYRQLDRVLDGFGRRPVGAAVPVGGGTLNWNYRVETTSGPVFARRWRTGHAAGQIRAEHELLNWVAARGIPAIRPFKSRDGDTVMDVEGANWSLFPWVEGRTTVRGEIGTDDARALGEMHGRIHAVLAEHPMSGGEAGQLPWDTAESLADLVTVRQVAVERGTPREVVEGIDLQMRLLETSLGRPRSDFSSGLTTQLTHGDYHDQQVLFGADGSIVAVNDWEMYRVLPRVWEVLRAVAFARLYEEPGLSAYVSGYARHMQLSEEECRLAIESWWCGRLHSRWVYWTHFMENNERVAEFFPETRRELARLADERWRADLADRFVRAATG